MSKVENIETVTATVASEEVRELVRVVLVDDIIKHPNADAMELAIVGGWQCCVKLGEFKKGGLAMYCEIDSLLPLSNPNFTFLESRKTDLKMVGEEAYSRIKTIRLRKELSQGLLLPLPKHFYDKPVGTNLTTELGVLKYEGVVENSESTAVYTDSRFGRLCRFIAGGDAPKLQRPWPTYLKKSNQSRVQNIAGMYTRAAEQGEEFELSVKLDGGSMTSWLWASPVSGDHPDLIVKQLVYGVGSRNNELSQEDVIWGKVEQLRRWIAALLMTNRRMFSVWRFTIPRWATGIVASNDIYVATSNRLKLKEILIEHYTKTGQVIALQGELCGPSIQSNFEGLDEHMFFVYSVYVQDGDRYREMFPGEARELVAILGLEYVPVLSSSTKLPSSVKDCLLLADGSPAFKPKGYREGVVYKSTFRDFSFKAISNSYLLKVSD